MALLKRPLTPQREIVQNLDKIPVNYFFDEKSIYEISKPYLNICSDGRTSPKQYAPSTFQSLGIENMSE